jgi:hypothetical protein
VFFPSPIGYPGAEQAYRGWSDSSLGKDCVKPKGHWFSPSKTVAALIIRETP